MNARFRLASVLRARQAQEDAAKGAVVRARVVADAATADVRRREQVLDARTALADSSAQAYVAALSSLRGLAAELSTASRFADGTDETLADQLTAWTDASGRRRMVEKLAERHAVTVRQSDAAAEQRVVDDLATTTRQRSEARRFEP